MELFNLYISEALCVYQYAYLTRDCIESIKDNIHIKKNFNYCAFYNQMYVKNMDSVCSHQQSFLTILTQCIVFARSKGLPIRPYVIF